VHQVRGGVRPGDRAPALDVDLGLHVGTDDGVRTLRSDDGSSWETTEAKMPKLSVEEVVVAEASEEADA